MGPDGAGVGVGKRKLEKNMRMVEGALKAEYKDEIGGEGWGRMGPELE